MISSVIRFIEYLTVQNWIIYIFPRLLWEHFKKRQSTQLCYVFDSSKFAISIAKIFGIVTETHIEKLHFRLTDIRDDDGQLVRLRLEFQDLAEIRDEISNIPEFNKLIANDTLPYNLPEYILKNAGSAEFFHIQSMWRTLFIIQVCKWKTEKLNTVTDQNPLLFITNRPWSQAINKYADTNNIRLCFTRRYVPLLSRMKNHLSLRTKMKIRLFLKRLNSQNKIAFVKLSALTNKKRDRTNTSTTMRKELQATSQPIALIEYTGHLNIDEAGHYSDLFFWQESKLLGSDLAIVFGAPPIENHAPITEYELAKLTDNNITAISIRPQATMSNTLVPFIPTKSTRFTVKRELLNHFTSLEKKWLRQQIRSYSELKEYWVSLFATYNVKTHITWYKYDSSHYVITAAMRELGGISTIYQRAYESHPSAATCINTDIVFGFSPAVAQIENLSGSKIKYHVSVGYIGDHRSELIRPTANRTRQYLIDKGCSKIIAYYDENSADDIRWHTGHEFMQDNYDFLLRKVLENPWLGLIIKPKSPSTLRQRLNNVSDLLTKAEETGRCIIYGGTDLRQSHHSPSEASLAADIAIHGHLCAGTAGVESALTGTTTLLLDREGWPNSPLYKLGQGSVVFTEWESLWETCCAYWKNCGAVPQFGDWSPILEELDPFRDGKAAHRMGTYIKWLLEGYKSGARKESIMANAAERYASVWGLDKIVEINNGINAPNFG